MLRMAIEAGVAGISLEVRAKFQFCVPAITIRGDSYRLREKRRSGLLKGTAVGEPEAAKKA